MVYFEIDREEKLLALAVHEIKSGFQIFISYIIIIDKKRIFNQIFI